MELVPKTPTRQAPADTFTGDAWIDQIASGHGPMPLRVNLVRFAPGARNAWHVHLHGQTLHIVDGRAPVQARRGPVLELGPGETVWTPPGEWHWHGATPEDFMAHLAIWHGAPEGAEPETQWGDLVTDEEYAARAR